MNNPKNILLYEVQNTFHSQRKKLKLR